MLLKNYRGKTLRVSEISNNFAQTITQICCNVYYEEIVNSYCLYGNCSFAERM